MHHRHDRRCCRGLEAKPQILGHDSRKYISKSQFLKILEDNIVTVNPALPMVGVENGKGA